MRMTSRLILFRETVAVYCKNLTRHLIKLSGHNVASMIKEARSSETSVKLYYTIRCHIFGDSSFRRHCTENIKSEIAP